MRKENGQVVMANAGGFVSQAVVGKRRRWSANTCSDGQTQAVMGKRRRLCVTSGDGQTHAVMGRRRSLCAGGFVS